MTCFIRRLRVCPDSLVNDTTHHPLDSPGGFLQLAAFTYSLHHWAHQWHLKRTLDVFWHSRQQAALQTRGVCKGNHREIVFYSCKNTRAPIDYLGQIPSLLCAFFMTSCVAMNYGAPPFCVQEDDPFLEPQICSTVTNYSFVNKGVTVWVCYILHRLSLIF